LRCEYDIDTVTVTIKVKRFVTCYEMRHHYDNHSEIMTVIVILYCVIGVLGGIAVITKLQPFLYFGW